jgi:hypothetical protein
LSQPFASNTARATISIAISPRIALARNAASIFGNGNFDAARRRRDYLVVAALAAA